MQSEPRDDKPQARIPPPLGLVRQPSQDDPRLDSKLLAAIERVAPGTDLRQGIDDIIRSREGALIVIGEPQELAFLFSGGIRLGQPFRSQLLYELAKMDGAIIVTTDLSRLAFANVQLMPDPTIPSAETGTRHRTAERVAKQTDALVISISQQRSTISLFAGQGRYQLDPIADVLAKTNQAIATLDTYRQRLEQVLTRLTALEFQNAVVLDDVLVVLQRAEMNTRMADEFELLAVLGYPASVNPLDHSVAPRGIRVLSHIPRLPEGVIRRVVTTLDGLEAIVRASQRDLEAVEGVGSVRAREIREGLRRLQEHNLVDRYLSI